MISVTPTGLAVAMLSLFLVSVIASVLILALLGCWI
jgi:hypothetical protein